MWVKSVPQYNPVNGFQKSSSVLNYTFLVCIGVLPQFLIFTLLTFYVIFSLVTELFLYLDNDQGQWGLDVAENLFPEDSHIFQVLSGSPAL